MSGSVIKIELNLPVEVRQDGGGYVSSCRALDVHAQGETELEAMDELKDALTLFLSTCMEMGTLEQVLKESGFSVSSSGTASDYGGEFLTVPIPLLLSARNHAENHTH